MRLHRNSRRHALLFVGVALSTYFSYHVMFGARSYAHLVELNAVVDQKESSLVTIKAKREALERDVVMLRPETLSADLLEERARIILGYKKADEYFVFDK